MKRITCQVNESCEKYYMRLNECEKESHRNIKYSYEKNYIRGNESQGKTHVRMNENVKWITWDFHMIHMGKKHK